MIANIKEGAACEYHGQGLRLDHGITFFFALHSCIFRLIDHYCATFLINHLYIHFYRLFK